jgi:hypothetical protein
MGQVDHHALQYKVMTFANDRAHEKLEHVSLKNLTMRCACSDPRHSCHDDEVGR